MPSEKEQLERGAQIFYIKNDEAVTWVVIINNPGYFLLYKLMIIGSPVIMGLI